MCAGAVWAAPCDELLNQRGAVGKQTFSESAAAPLAQYFPDTVTVESANGLPVEVTLFTPENLEHFVTDVRALLAARANMIDFPLAGFQNWLNHTRGGVIPIPEPFAMHNEWIHNGAALGTYVDFLVNEFVQASVPNEVSRGPLARGLARFDFRRDPMSARARRILRRLGGGLSGALFLTAVLQLQGPVSGFVSVPLNPINDYTSRLGVRYLSWTASILNDVVNKVDNALTASKQKTPSADLQNALLVTADSLGKYNFKGLTHDQTKAIWDKFETRWFDYTQNMGKLLNGDEAAGRSMYFGARISTPETYALSITQVRTNVLVTKAAVERLEEKIDASVDHQATLDQAAQLSELNTELTFDKHLLSLVMCDWLVSHLFYPEQWNAKQLKNSGDSAFATIDEFLGFPQFMQDLKVDIIETFAVVDHDLTGVADSIPDKGK